MYQFLLYHNFLEALKLVMIKDQFWPIFVNLVV